MTLMSIDLGTSSVKVTVHDHETGKVLAFGRGHYPLITEKQGYVEQNPNQWWSATKEAVQQCLKNFTRDPSLIKGIGLSGQMCGVTPVDKKGNALYNCITYLDTRCTEELALLKTKEIDIVRVGLNPISNLMSAPKILWLKNNRPDIWKETYKWLMPKDFIRLKLTGTFGTDPTDASATLFMDFFHKTWDPIIEEFGLYQDKFVEINQSSEVIGTVTKQAAEETGLLEGIPVVAGGADMVCTALGTRAIKEGTISLTIGTAGHVIAPIAKPELAYAKQLFQFCHAIPDLYYAFGAVFAGGLSLAWFKEILTSLGQENLREDDVYREINREAGRVSSGSSGLFFLPFLTGSGVPYSDPKAKGSFIGLSVRHTSGQMARAIMEGVSYNFRQIVDTMESTGIPVREIYLGEGGSKSILWSNILTAIIDRGSVGLMENKDSAPVGAAILAGIGTGLYGDWTEAVTKLTQVRSIEKDMPMSEQYRKGYNVYQKLYPALQDIFTEIHEMEEQK